MKVSIDIDCTPEEARTLLGLPDLKPMQERLLIELESQLKSAMQSMDASAYLKAWQPLGLEGLKMFQSMMATAAGAASGASPKPERDKK